MLNDCFQRSRGAVLLTACISMVALTACSDDWQDWWPSGHGDDDGDEGAAGSGSTDGGSSESQACGGLQGLRCDEGEYCKYEIDAQCGAADQTGVCTPKPELCTLELKPVCGCDSRTYSNACAAAAAGVSVSSEDECAEERCGGYAGLKCEEGEYCNLAEGQGCGVAGASGICREIPRVCTREYRPVCGCNDKTYANACLAAAEAQPVRAEGECPPVQ